MATRYIGDATIRVEYSGSDHYRGRDYYAGTVSAGGYTWHFDGIGLPFTGIAADSSEAYDRAAATAATFGSAFTKMERGRDTPEWAPPVEVAEAIDEAVGWARNDQGQYLVRRSRGGPGHLAERVRELRLPKRVGQRTMFRRGDQTLMVKRTPSQTYFLKVSGSTRSRWADNAEDARRDIRHFVDYGNLPRGSNWPPFEG